MPKYFLTIEYDGRCFAGWQRQPGQPTVQEHIENAFCAIGEQNVLVYGAGRTDAGVHAWNMVAHVKVERAWSVRKLPLALNAHLNRQNVGIVSAHLVSNEAHARFDAICRSYVYVFLDRGAPSPFTPWSCVVASPHAECCRHG